MSALSLHTSANFHIIYTQLDPRLAEGNSLKNAVEKSNYSPEACEVYKAWNPIPPTSSRDVVKLAGRIHPATLKEGKLFKITDVGMDIFNQNFMAEPRLEEDLTQKVRLVGKCTTFHTSSFSLFFKPSIAEVMLQLPEEILALGSQLYFTTQTITDSPKTCTIGEFGRYHIAHTTVYQPVE
jgi:hypothetical protein